LLKKLYGAASFQSYEDKLKSGVIPVSQSNHSVQEESIYHDNFEEENLPQPNDLIEDQKNAEDDNVKNEVSDE